MGGVLGAFLKDLRSWSGHTQSQLARLADVPQPNISAYESGQRMPSAETLNRLIVGCGFRLAAAAEDDRVIVCDWPVEVRSARLAGDPPDETPTLDPDAPPAVRGRVLYDLLELVDALRPPR
jgi:transcriptional regulator with XRE-family HTH domain